MDDIRTESTIGERIKRLRNCVLMTQDDLAAAAGVSTDLIRKLEQGRRHTASIVSLYRIARALDVDVGELLGRARPQRSTDDGQVLVLPIRDALTPIDDLIGLIDDTGVPTVVELGRSVTYGWGAYWGGRYGLLAAMLPDLLAQSRCAAGGSSGPRAGDRPGGAGPAAHRGHPAALGCGGSGAHRGSGVTEAGSRW
jgi:transcriptional regulator with XRE-family HTH domain